MVWVDVGYERLPSGPDDLQSETFTSSSGHEFLIYRKEHDPKYLGFVAKYPPIEEASLNWNEFVEHAAEFGGSRYNTDEFDSNWCMANILFGSEIWWGEGNIDVERYTITSEY